jgi:UDP-N-acetylglucosamine 4,6-dehydratase/5-epimerase
MHSVCTLEWTKKTVLITGGTGSFGKKFIECMLKKYRPKKIIVFSRDELKQHEMRINGYDDPSLRYFIGDVRDVSRLRRAMREVDIVIHSAALKQVPACEYNPIEAVLTNVMGARNVIEAALDAEVERVVGLSTDKAVNPVNLYGATKLVAEKLFVQANSYSGNKRTRFACVRYGNVVGSRGSVIPLFLEQRKTGKITITDPRMTRFWITLEQGVQFVTRCVEQIRGGEVFVPQIPSMNIMDLAKTVAPECEHSLIGIRPGEKLHEVLIGEDESWHSVEIDGMFVIKPLHAWWNSENWSEGKTLPEGFRYSSDSNPSKLSVSELQKMIC